MSVLIDGMEMPKSCEDCPFGWYTRTGEKFCLTMIHGWQSNCPLVEVPPHGRLIDVDYADDYAYDELEVANSYLTGWEAARAMQKIYQNAPTIIEAEDGE